VMLRLHVHSYLNLLKINKTCLRNLNKTKTHILELRKINTIPHLVLGLLDCYLCNGESTTIWTPSTINLCLPGKLSQFILSRVEYCSVAYMVMAVMFNTTFNIISVISLWSVLLVDQTWVPGETHRPVASHWQTLSSTPRHEPNSNSHKLVVICSDCKGGCKSNYHTFTTTTTPVKLLTYSIFVNN
jgi:hypothetical protein